MCPEQIEMLCMEQVKTEPDKLLAEARVTMARARILAGVIPPLGASVGGLVQPGDVVEHIG